ncbi:MAG TPA: patatin-like phospholipase family protein [Rhodocyclaceae bacterium]|nr:patatin-like phospholipase family protein [Rhodocyclaceae bacterium]
MARRPPRIGIALGSGAARGWAHVGVLRALAREGIEPAVICGSSIGAFVGGIAAAGDLDKLADWVDSLNWQQVVGLLDMGLRGGLIKGDKLIDFFQRHFVDHDFASLRRPFGCVATDLQTGHEVWLRDGSVATAVRASIAMPGLMTPVVHEGRLLVDGGVVNPVPVSLARAMGADLVIAVDLNADVVGRAWRAPNEPPPPPPEAGPFWARKLLTRFGLGERPAGGAGDDEGIDMPSMLSVIQGSISIMSVRIARSRLAGEPADVLIAPRMAQVGWMEFHRGREGIAEGEAAVELALLALRRALESF